MTTLWNFFISSSVYYIVYWYASSYIWNTFNFIESYGFLFKSIVALARDFSLSLCVGRFRVESLMGPWVATMANRQASWHIMIHKAHGFKIRCIAYLFVFLYFYSVLLHQLESLYIIIIIDYLMNFLYFFINLLYCILLRFFIYLEHCQLYLIFWFFI